MDFSDTTFGAIDDDRIDEDSPASTALDHYLGANADNRFQQRGWRMAWSPIAERRLTSVEWSSFFVTPITLRPAHDTLDVAIGARFPDGTGNSVIFRVRVTDGERVFYDGQLNYNPDGSADPETVRIEQQPARVTTEPIAAVLKVECKSDDEISTTSSEGDLIGASRVYQSDEPTIGTAPDAAFGLVTDSGNDTAITTDLIQEAERISDPDSSDPDDGVYTIVRGPDQKTGDDSHHNDFASSVEVTRNAHFELYSVDVELTYDGSDTPIVTSAPSGRTGPLAAQKPYAAQRSSYAITRITRQAVDRPRCLCMGYRGNDRNDSAEDPWPTDEPELWAYSKADVTDTLIDRQSLAICERPDRDIEVRLLLAGFEVTSTHVEPDDGTHFEALQESAVEESWDLSFKIGQLQTGDTSPTQLGSQTTEYQVDMYPTDRSGRTAMPTQIWYLFNGHTAASGYPTDLAYIHREGQLYPTDYGLLQSVTQRVSTSSRSQNDPATLTVDATYNNSPGSVASSDAVLVVVGMSVWEVP